MSDHQSSSFNRRAFLEKSAKTITAGAAIQALSAFSFAAATTACGSSSASTNPASTTPPQPIPRQSMPRPIDWPANIGASKQVVILGAGIAGMTAAFEMKKLGFSCTILEATSRAGGRVRTIRNGDQIIETDSTQSCVFDDSPELYFNAGAARIPHHHELLLGYCRQFDVAIEPFINENKSSLFHSASAFNNQPKIARQVVSDSQGYIGELLASAINQGALDNDLSTTEKNNLLGLLQQFADLDSNFSYQGSSRAGFPGQENIGSRQRGANITPIPRGELLQSEFWQFKLDFFKDLNQQAAMLQPVGGMDAIPKAFEARLTNEIIYDAVVTQIRKTGSGENAGVAISYQDVTGNQLSVAADFCICTIPAPVLKDIANDFSAAHQSEIANFTYSRAGKLAFQSERFWETNHNIYGGISWTDQDITQIWYPSAGLGQSQGILLGAYTFGIVQGDRFSAQTPSARIASGITQASAIHSNFSSQVTNGISISWPKIPFQLGGWGNSQASVLLTEDNNIFFAGEHLSILQGWQEGAILSAYSAVDLVVAKLQ